MNIKKDKKETRGRKRLPEKDRKNKRLPVAFSQSDIENLRRRAKESDKTFTEFIRGLLKI